MSRVVSTKSLSPWPAIVTALGGGALGAGALAMAIGFVVEGPGAGFGVAFALVTTVLLALGGLCLAVGWGALATRGTVGFTPALAAILVPGAVLAGIVIQGQTVDVVMLRGLILFGALVLCAIAFFFGLGEGNHGTAQGVRGAVLSSARFGALLSVLGFGAVVFTFSRAIEVSETLGMIMSVTGFAGLGLLGLGLAAGISTATR